MYCCATQQSANRCLFNNSFLFLGQVLCLTCYYYIAGSLFLVLRLDAHIYGMKLGEKGIF